MAVNLAPIGNDAPYVDSNGDPFTGALLYTYTAGSSTPATTYTTSAGSVQNANPMTLNSAGYPTTSSVQTQIWLTAGVSYKFELKNSAGTTIWTRDNIVGINDTTVSQDQWVSGPTPTFVSTTSFTLVGDQTTTFHIGRRLKTTNSGGTIYSTITASAFGAVTTVTVVNDSGVLDSGLSAVSYGLLSAANPSEPHIGDVYVCNGRLTLTTGVPVTTSDVTAAETVYFTPYKGNKVDLYDSTAARWVRYKFSELSLDVPDAAQMNDVFLYNNAGTLTLEAVAWTNDTTRATALTTQDGVYVKTGALGRRYLGSFYSSTAGNGQTEDSFAKRYLWNYYNRVNRPMRNANETTDSWGYATATLRQANANTANQLEMVVGVSEDTVRASVSSSFQNSVNNGGGVVGIGLDSTSANATGIQAQESQFQVGGVGVATLFAQWSGFPGVGKHFLAWLEAGNGSGTQTWFGDNGDPGVKQSGINGEMLG